MINFKVETRTQFWGQDNKRVEGGNWNPTYFCYWTDSRTGKQWLIVGPNEEVNIDKGIETLAGPCVAKKHYKTLPI